LVAEAFHLKKKIKNNINKIYFFLKKHKGNMLDSLEGITTTPKNIYISGTFFSFFSFFKINLSIKILSHRQPIGATCSNIVFQVTTCVSIILHGQICGGWLGRTSVIEAKVGIKVCVGAACGEAHLSWCSEQYQEVGVWGVIANETSMIEVVGNHS
jgi:hypothetical protein